MCGIIGMFGDKINSYQSAFSEGMDKIQHRGPDASNIFSDELLRLGHHRLKIIDLSDAANQPFQDNRFVLAFNGEIYNYLEIKSRFGFETKTTSDTEVLFLLLKRFYPDIPRCLSYINGMFAIVFYDRFEKSLWLIRDRLGVKPLLYSIVGQNIFFASEAKALTPFLPQRDPNHKSVINFLINRTHSYSSTTFFVGIQKIKAATCHELRWTGTLKRKEINYWEPRKLVCRVVGDETKTIESFAELLLDSLSLRFRSDVPVAILLSGGLDSSTIAALAASQHSEREIRCITATYPGDPKDERELANKIVQKFDNLKPVWIEIKKRDFMKATFDTVYVQETPIPDGSMVAHYLLMKHIQTLGLKVVLTGQGGDEILAGYTHTFIPAAAADDLRRGNLTSLGLKSLYHALPCATKNLLRSFSYRKNLYRYFQSPDALKLIDKYFWDLPGHGILTSYLLTAIEYWSLPAYLHYDDRNSMAFGVESRAPFLDFRLVEFMLTLPNTMKIRNGESKWILRRALADTLPKEIINRKDKQSFHAPIDQWSSTIPTDFLVDKDFQETFPYLNFSAIQEEWAMKWRIFSLWVWYRQYIKPTLSQGRPALAENLSAGSL